MLAFRLLPFLSLTASQCMYVERQMKGCVLKPVNRRSITWCMDECLSNTRGYCYFIQWNQRTGVCYIGHKSLRKERSEGECITLRKYNCNRVTDQFCLKEDSLGGFEVEGENFRVKGMKRALECRSVSALAEASSAYIWNQVKQLCTLKIGGHRRRSRKNLLKGDVQGIKPFDCNEGDRCVALKISANRGGATRDRSARTLVSCFRLILTKDDADVVEWNYQNNDCWVHTRKGIITEYKPNLPIFEMMKSLSCKKGNKTTCVEKRMGVRMKGGFKLNVAEEKECLEICKSMANCAAVDWDNNGHCVFHHFEKPLEHDQPQYTSFLMTDCSDKQVPEVGTPCHYATSRLQSMSSSKMSHREKTACLMCAHNCCIKSCAGFSYRLHGGVPLCDITEVTDPMYVSKT